MRFKDTKQYFFTALFAYVIIIVFAVLYETYIENKVIDNAKETMIDSTELDIHSVYNEILIYKSDLDSKRPNDDLFILDTNSELIDRLKTCESGTLIKQASTIEGNKDENYYFYLINSDKDTIGKVSIDKIFKPISNQNIVIANKNDGENIYGTKLNGSLYNILKNGGYNEIDSLKAKLNNNESVVIDLHQDKTDFYVSLYTFGGDLYLAKIISGEEVASSIKQLRIQAVIFMAVIAVAMTIIIYLGFRLVKKYNKLILASRHSASRSDSIIIQAKKNGEFINIYHKIHKLSRSLHKYKSIFEFEMNDGRRTKDVIKKGEKLLIVFKDETPIYIEFIPYTYAGTYYLLGRDVTADYNHINQLEALTSKNPLTNFFNYTKLYNDFSSLLARNSDQSLLFMLVNLHEFNENEKLFGLDTMKNILIETSNRINDIASDIYHVSNDTFFVAIAGNTKDEAYKKSERIVKALGKTFDIKTNTLYIKFKFSTIEYDTRGNSTFDDIYRHLELALERAKSSLNRNLIKYDNTVENYANYMATMQHDLQLAIENNEFQMYYQPQYDVLENRIAGFEALIRWNNPKYINVSPQEYIELAERCGYIIDIGNFITREVFKAAKLFEPFGVHLSINISPAQIFQAGFTSFLLEEFEANKLKSGSIAIEITETFLMENFQTIVDKLNILRQRGFSIHLDDFGTGYSSLLYLKELPIDTIKTDKEFLKGISAGEETQQILKGIISLAKALNLSVISEGVETNEQATILRKLGTNYFQGWLISKALPLDDALNMVKSGYKLKTTRR